MVNLSPEEFIAIMLGNNKESAENYLQREEKILSLLRDKKVKAFTKNDYLELVNIRSYEKKDIYEKAQYLSKCAIKALKALWLEACAKNNYSEFLEKVGCKNATVSILHKECDEYYILSHKLKKKNFVGGVKIVLGDKEINVPIGDVEMSETTSNTKWHIPSRLSSYHIIADATKYFKGHFVYHSIKNYILKEFEGLTDEQLKDNRIYAALKNQMDERIRKYKAVDPDIAIPNNLLNHSFMRRIADDYHITISNGNNLSLIDGFPYWFMTEDPYVYEQYSLYDFNLHKLFCVISDIYYDEKQSQEFLGNIARDYATVYETKKAIPEKVLYAMEQSKFNKYFGYVEIDSDCELEKIKEIELEFEALQTQIFHSNEREEEVSLRFRKLGKHRAAGLYFPTLKCLCVDIRTPSSFAHEYGHMLDYKYGEVSKGVKFSSVKERYRTLLKDFVNALDKDDPLKKKLNGGTKYNLNYFLEPTEVFARCLEMYLIRYKKINNSLVSIGYGFEYPEDNQLMELIAEYFNYFFSVEPTVKKSMC